MTPAAPETPNVLIDPTNTAPTGDQPKPRRGIRRREVLFGGGGIALGLAGAFAGIGAASAIARSKPTSSSPSSSASAYTIERFTSTMVTAPKLAIWKQSDALLADGHLFATPQTDQFSPAIYDTDGMLIWSHPGGGAGTDFRVQQYEGRPVLTYWTGTSQYGNGQGHGVILDNSYQPIAHVYAQGGLQADLHEFELTDAGTALITSYPPVRADLTSVGGKTGGWMFDCHIQEIDIATSRLLLDWRASDHIPLTESYVALGSDGGTAPTAYDPYHLNAISADSDGTLLLSARHTHTVYSLDRTSGAIRWRLGGKKSDFAVDADAAFAWQHHARRQSADEISMFDNHVNTSKGTSRGLVLSIDESAKTATLKQEYADRSHVGFAMGSTQLLGNGNVLVGWGTQPYATEFTADGTPVWEASGLGADCYRVAKSTWVGQPKADPDIATVTDPSGRLRVSASWNGATEVASWRILSGATNDSLSAVATIPKDGFETTSTIDGAAFVQVLALDANGTSLGSSTVVAT